MLDYLIENGLVIDGSGGTPFRADVGIQGDEIAFVAPKKPEGAQAKTTIDASEQIVTPGFIDIHCHSDAVIFHEGKNPKRLLQGFTTEVIGNCGISPAPVSQKSLSLLKRYCAPFFSYMPLPYNWTGFGEYLAELEKRKPLLNTAALVGHGSLRIAVAGFDDRALSDSELAEMKRLLRESLEQGAFGMSSGLFYPPGVFSDNREILELAKITADCGGIYATHLRSESEKLIEAVAETLKIAEESGVSLEFSHHKASGRRYFGSVKTTLAMMEEANQKGLCVNCDVYPYIAANTQFSSILPPWAQEGGTDALLARLADDALSARMIRDLKNEGDPYENLYQLSGWDKIMINECSKSEFVGKTVLQLAQERNADPFRTALNVIRESDNSAMMIIELMSEQDVSEVLAAPYSMVCTDGFPSLGKCHPRYTSSFIRVLEKYVKKEHLLSLQSAVRKMSGLPAQKLGLSDRGLLKAGYKADLLIMDFAALHDNANYERYDALADGIRYVFINGEAALADGVDQKVCAGRVLRSGEKR